MRASEALVIEPAALTPRESFDPTSRLLGRLSAYDRLDAPQDRTAEIASSGTHTPKNHAVRDPYTPWVSTTPNTKTETAPTQCDDR